MTTFAATSPKQAGPAETTSAGRPPFGDFTMFAISFDLDIETLRQTYGDPYNNAYREIRLLLNEHGFRWQQGSVYFGNESTTPVDCVLTTYAMVEALPWFASSVRDIRMLRIEATNNLMPAVEFASKRSR